MISLINLMIAAIIVFAAIGIALVAIRASGVPIPSWVIQIGSIILIAIVAILAIKFLLSAV